MASNASSDVPPKCDSNHQTSLVVPVFHMVMFPVALVLNCTAAWVSLHLRSTSTFMFYLKNLVVSDLVITFTLPIKAMYSIQRGSIVFQIFYCRYLSPVFYSSMYISIALLGLVSLDRFFKIIQPCGTMLSQNMLLGKLMAALVWVNMIGAMVIPTIVLTNRSHPNMTMQSGCMLLKGPAGVHFHRAITIFVNIFFWLVSVQVLVCYICITKRVIGSFRSSGSRNSQGKQKTKLRVFLVVVVFFVSFGPYHVVRIPYTFQQTKSIGTCPETWTMFTKEFSLLISTANICLDPLLYFFLCREYREKLTAMVKGLSSSLRVTSKELIEWLVNIRSGNPPGVPQEVPAGVPK